MVHNQHRESISSALLLTIKWFEGWGLVGGWGLRIGDWGLGVGWKQGRDKFHPSTMPVPPLLSPSPHFFPSIPLSLSLSSLPLPFHISSFPLPLSRLFLYSTGVRLKLFGRVAGVTIYRHDQGVLEVAPTLSLKTKDRQLPSPQTYPPELPPPPPPPSSSSGKRCYLAPSQ